MVDTFPRNFQDFVRWIFFLGICGTLGDLAKLAPWMVQNFLGVCGILMDD